eukprot:COSAG05_NODE_29435_length_108_cov_50.000000_1_plen_35_part_11
MHTVATHTTDTKHAQHAHMSESPVIPPMDSGSMPE